MKNEARGCGPRARGRVGVPRQLGALAASEDVEEINDVLVFGEDVVVVEVDVVAGGAVCAGEDVEEVDDVLVFGEDVVVVEVDVVAAAGEGGQFDDEGFEEAFGAAASADEVAAVLRDFGDVAEFPLEDIGALGDEVVAEVVRGAVAGPEGSGFAAHHVDELGAADEVAVA